MLTRWGLVTRRSDIDADELKRLWKDVHAPITMKAQFMRQYYLNVVRDAQQRGISFPRCSVEVDGMAEVWFDSVYEMENSLVPELNRELAADAAHFASDIKAIITVKNTVIPMDTSRPLIKRLSLIKRRPEISVSQFKHEWWDVHSEYIRQFNGVRGYYQALLIDRLVKGQHAPYEQIPFDGVVELYFDDVAALEADFASAAGQKAAAHAKTFIESVSAYIVERIPIKE